MNPILLNETRTVGHLVPQVLIDVTAGQAASPDNIRPPSPMYTTG